MDGNSDPKFIDATSGETLPAKETMEARWEEMRFMEGWKVWGIVPESECWRMTG